jgi:hypothetical protein
MTILRIHYSMERKIPVFKHPRECRMPDVRPVLGAIVFFAILALVGASLYYFFMVKPEKDRLESTRTSALSEVRSLYANLTTEQAVSASQEYFSKIGGAKTLEEINRLLADARAAATREKKRAELLKKVEEASSGTFHSASDVPVLNQTASTLKDQIRTKATLSELQWVEASIDEQMTSAWRQYFLSQLEGVENSRRVVLVLGKSSWLYMTAENARSYIRTKTWGELKGMDLEMSSRVEVTVQDTFARTPKVRPGTLVNIYVYDTSKKELSLLVGGARVLSAVYPQEVLSSISWTSPDGTTTYSVDIWETLKAQAAGSSAAAGVPVDNYANKVIDKGLGAGLGMYQLSVLYTVEVPEGAGRLISQYELHETDKDIILIPVLS